MKVIRVCAAEAEQPSQPQPLVLSRVRKASVLPAAAATRAALTNALLSSLLHSNSSENLTIAVRWYSMMLARSLTSASDGSNLYETSRAIVSSVPAVLPGALQ